MTIQKNKTETRLLKRHEVEICRTWDLKDLFENLEEWKKAFEALPTQAELQKDLSQLFRGHLLTGGPVLIHSALQTRHALMRKLGNLETYAHLKNAENVADSASNAAVAKITSTRAQLMAEWSFLEPELLKIESLTLWISQHPLNEFQFELSELLRSKEHILTDREESILTQLSTPLGQFYEIHSKWNNVDLKYPPAKDSHGQEYLVTTERLSQLYASNDRTLRRSASESLFGELKKSRHMIAANYFAQCLSGSTVARIKGFKSFLESQLFPDNIPLEIYDNLISSVRNNLKSLHRSMLLRKKSLNIDRVFLFDRYVSLAKNTQEPTISYDEACELILKAVAPLGNDYVAAARQGLTEQRWVDWAENEGKRSGAFSSGTYDSNPVILITWTGSLRNLYTLAHELGHSMHTWLTNKNQPYHLSNYTIFVAEVASTLNEILLSDYILTHMPDSELAGHCLSQWLMGFEGTVLRQTLFAAFERDASRRVDTGEALTADTLDEVYAQLVNEWYGPDSGFDPEHASEWMRIPHFYFNFYVYKYATSYCSALALFEELQRSPSGQNDVQARILNFLKAGGSKPSLDILRDAGVDLRTPAPIEKAFRAYERFLERAEKTFL